MRKDGVVMRIITVSREFGSGGREVGKRLADELGIAYYDREIITAIAEKSSLDEDYVEKMIESRMYKSYPFTFSHTFAYVPAIVGTASEIISQQSTVIKELAGKSDCVIVGRGADVILENESPFRLFVYADMQSKLARCRSRAKEDENLTERQLMKKIKSIDKGRKESHDILSPYPWGDRRGYNLCINTTGVQIKTMIPYIAEYIKAWFDNAR